MSSNAAPHDAKPAPGAAGLSREQLAAVVEKVYRLLQAELRLDRARGARPRPGKER